MRCRPLTSRIAALACLLVSVPAGSALAQVTSVPCDANALILAIANANLTPAADVLSLTPGCTYTLTSVHNSADGANGLPVIAAVATGGALTIQGGGATIARSTVAGTPEFRILYVAQGASVLVNDVTVHSARGQIVTENTLFTGGGIHNRGTLVLSDVSIRDAMAFLGGGIYNDGALTMDRSSVMDNVSFQGGGIYNLVTATLIDSAVIGNRAAGGGGIYNQGGEITSNDSQLILNVAGSSGGGLVNLSDGTVLLNNSILFFNSAADGAAIMNAGEEYQPGVEGLLGLVPPFDTTGGTITLNNSTISTNQLTGNEASSAVYNNPTGTIALYNSIFANTINGADCENLGTLTAFYSVVEAGSCGISGTAAAPDANGSFSGDPGLDLELVPLPGADVIDRGNPANPLGSTGACLSADFSGIPRPLDGDGDGTARCDIGAFEAPMPVPEPGSRAATAAGVALASLAYGRRRLPSGIR